MTDDHKPNLREIYGPRFTWDIASSYTNIYFDGNIFARIKRAKGLPQGFTDRAIEHFFEMLVGTRTELWDEQTTYGEYKRSASEVRRRAKMQGAENVRRIEEGTKP